MKQRNGNGVERTGAANRPSSGSLFVDGGNPNLVRYEADDPIPVNLFGPRLRREHNAFSTSTFFFELFTQLLHPLLLPWVLHRQNKQAAINKGYLPGKQVFVFQTVMHILMYLPVVLVILQRHFNKLKFVMTMGAVPLSPPEATSPPMAGTTTLPPFGSDTPVPVATKAPPTFLQQQFEVEWSILAAGLGTAFAVFRVMVIAGKYGCFPKHVYANILKPEEDITTKLLLASWNGAVEDTVVANELEMAQEYARCCLRKRYFYLADGNTVVSAHAYAFQLAQKTFGAAMPPVLVHIGKIIGLLLGILPCWIFFQEELTTTERKDPWSIAIVVVSTVQIVAFGIPVFGFLSVAMQHHIRFAKMHRALLSAMMLTGGRRRVERPTQDEFMIPLRNPNNLVVWVTTRHVLKYYARVYANRVSFNLFAMLVTCGFLALVLIQQAIAANKNIPLIVTCGIIFFLITLGCLITVFFAFRSDFSGTAVLKLIAEEQLSILWEQMIASKREEKREKHLDVLRSVTRGGSGRGGLLAKLKQGMPTESAAAAAAAESQTKDAPNKGFSPIHSPVSPPSSPKRNNNKSHKNAASSPSLEEFLLGTSTTFNEDITSSSDEGEDEEMKEFLKVPVSREPEHGAEEREEGEPKPLAMHGGRTRGMSVVVQTDDKKSLDEFQAAAEVVREVVIATNDADPVTVMFIPASPELISFIISLFVSGIMLVAAVLASSFGESIIPA